MRSLEFSICNAASLWIIYAHISAKFERTEIYRMRVMDMYYN